MRTNFYASENLRRLYRERVGDSMTQAQFAKRFKVGGQSMIAQIMSGDKPLPVETAAKLARALHCTIYDICPEMADFIHNELLPALGKGLRRAAALLLCILIPSLSVPLDAKAAAFNITVSQITHCVRLALRWLSEFTRHCALHHAA